MGQPKLYLCYSINDFYAPSLEKIYPPRNFDDRFSLWSLKQKMKPRPYFFALWAQKIYYTFHGIRARMKGQNIHSDEGIEACDFQIDR